MKSRTIREFEALLAYPGDDRVFSEADLKGLPQPVRRYLSSAIEPGTPLAVSVRLRMRGSIKIGRWLPFRAKQVLSPRRGFVWAATVAGVISGSDHYAEGHGALDWKLVGLVRVVHADGPVISRSSAERAAAEAVWVPTALLPRFDGAWSAADASHINARYHVEDKTVHVHYQLGDDGTIRSLVFDRWGDPDIRARGVCTVSVARSPVAPRSTV